MHHGTESITDIKMKNNGLKFKIKWFYLIMFVMVIVATLAGVFCLISQRTVEKTTVNQDGTTTIQINTVRKDKRYTLYQLPLNDADGGCAYAIELTDGGLLMIDSGYQSDAQYLREFILEHGGEVEAWFVSHPHFDHAGGILQLLQEEAQAVIDGKEKQISINTVYYAPFTADFFTQEAEDKDLAVLNKSILYYELEAIKAHEEQQQNGTAFQPVGLGQEFEFDGIKITCMNSFNPELYDVNANSLVLRINMNDIIFLFTGDITDQSISAMQEYWKDSKMWESDYVQVPHHGYLAGITSDQLYKLTMPKAVYLDCSKNEYQNDAVSIKEHVKWLDDLKIPVIKRFEGTNSLVIE